jgi:hypothetical protein
MMMASTKIGAVLGVQSGTAACFQVPAFPLDFRRLPLAVVFGNHVFSAR